MKLMILLGMILSVQRGSRNVRTRWCRIAGILGLRPIRILTLGILTLMPAVIETRIASSSPSSWHDLSTPSIQPSRGPTLSRSWARWPHKAAAPTGSSCFPRKTIKKSMTLIILIRAYSSRKIEQTIRPLRYDALHSKWWKGSIKWPRLYMRVLGLNYRRVPTRVAVVKSRLATLWATGLILHSSVSHRKAEGWLSPKLLRHLRHPRLRQKQKRIPNLNRKLKNTFKDIYWAIKNHLEGE